jgi:hypothetical protein
VRLVPVPQRERRWLVDFWPLRITARISSSPRLFPLSSIETLTAEGADANAFTNQFANAFFSLSFPPRRSKRFDRCRWTAARTQCLAPRGIIAKSKRFA